MKTCWEQWSLNLRQRSQLKGRLQTSHQIARERLKLGKKRGTEHDDNNTEEIQLNVRDKVLLYSKIVRIGRSKNLRSPWIGPYEIVAIYKIYATIKKGRKLQKVPKNQYYAFFRLGRVIV